MEKHTSERIRTCENSLTSDLAENRQVDQIIISGSDNKLRNPLGKGGGVQQKIARGKIQTTKRLHRNRIIRGGEL